jgi:dihydroorotate dehydrogenase (NAD+) catalytic subunit
VTLPSSDHETASSDGGTGLPRSDRKATQASLEEGVDLAGLALAHPVLNGSGTFDAIAALRTFGAGVLERFPFAAFVSKTITLAPRGGNPPPRLWETPAGMINSIGLPNKGLAGFLEQDLPELRRLPVPLIVSVAGFSHEEFARLVEGVAERPEIAALELNVSCPNVKSGCVMGSDPAETAALLGALRTRTRKPLIVKLTPNAGDVGAVAEAAAEGGADALSLINTLRGMAVHPETGRLWLGAGSGGLSGPAVRPVALAMTHEVASRVSLPLVGMGGIECGQDALDFVSAGATCVAVGTESFRDPAAGARVRQELREVMLRRNLRSFREVGPAQIRAVKKVPASSA